MHARSVARDDFKQALYVAICKAFLKVFRNQRIEFVVKSFTSEAQSELEGIEISAGERAPLPPPPPQKSQAELLEEQVRDDWKQLPTDKLKIKINRDPQYKKVFDELMNSDQLESVATTYHDHGKELS